MILFPLDTMKTRLQSEQGFRQAGGFKAIYKGIGTQAIGSAPQGNHIYTIFKELNKFQMWSNSTVVDIL